MVAYCRRAIRLLCVALSTLCMPAWGMATLPPSIANGVAWLQAQVQADGSLANEANSIVLPIKTQTESLQALSTFSATGRTSLITARSNDAQSITEFIKRQAIALAAAVQPKPGLIAVQKNHFDVGAISVPAAHCLLAQAQSNAFVNSGEQEGSSD
jgi:hypothetical protein